MFHLNISAWSRRAFERGRNAAGMLIKLGKVTQLDEEEGPAQFSTRNYLSNVKTKKEKKKMLPDITEASEPTHFGSLRNHAGMEKTSGARYVEVDDSGSVSVVQKEK